MRWIPFFVISSISFLSGVYILTNVKEFEKRRMALFSLGYLTFIGVILFTPMSFDGRSVYVMPAGAGSVNIHRIYYDLGFIENIILTIPLGYLIKEYFAEISLFDVIPIGLIVGASIETLQFYLSHLFLINRTSDISDVISNGVGIFIGASLFLVYQYASKKRLFEKWI
ncbi:VanZ family protein [Companilactobacillus baiquanensis]|uniref:VanZ family protein n=1 Tax=Companilactobacillus baiquanensis TaxID=2486005 RepID=A0ABW1UV76_9LACO|nr:VanZ family protein [Companilactobacillus baiquanensis]